MAMGQNSEDRQDGASEPSESNSIHEAAARRQADGGAVAPGVKAD